MEGFETIEAGKLSENFIRLIGQEWMLVTAGESGRFNTMTASWGGIGYLWNKPVAFVFIRPQRYTFGFMEAQDGFTLSFLGENNREALNICGTLSGRDVNKVEQAGLTPVFSASGQVAFAEARYIVECKKMYAGFLDPEAFLDPILIDKFYPEKDFHKMYIAEVVKVWKKK